MDMGKRANKSVGQVVRGVGKRLAVLTLGAFMLGIMIHGGMQVADAAAANQDFPPGPYATSQDYPPGPYAMSQDYPPGPSVTSQLFPPGPSVDGIVVVG
jgi:hypothetical protein